MDSRIEERLRELLSATAPSDPGSLRQLLADVGWLASQSRTQLPRGDKGVAAGARVGSELLAPVIQALEHGDPGVLVEAVFVLGELGDGQVVRTLAEDLDPGPEPSRGFSEPRVRAEICNALGKIGGADAIERLLGLYGNATVEPGEAVEAAALALWALGVDPGSTRGRFPALGPSLGPGSEPHPELDRTAEAVTAPTRSLAVRLLAQGLAERARESS